MRIKLWWVFSFGFWKAMTSRENDLYIYPNFASASKQKRHRFCMHCVPFLSRGLLSRHARRTRRKRDYSKSIGAARLLTTKKATLLQDCFGHNLIYAHFANLICSSLINRLYSPDSGSNFQENANI